MGRRGWPWSAGGSPAWRRRSGWWNSILARVALFERGSRLGGVLWTIHESGFQVEQSADNFITTVPWGLDLCKRLGLGDELVQTNPDCRRTYVVRSGRLYRLPDGFMMMAPTQMWPLAVTPILSPLGKFRAALEYFLPARRDGADESMAAFVRRRLGREVFDRLVEPLVSAVYAADMEKLSVLATLPRFREMESEYGSLIRAMRAQMKTLKGGRPAPSQSGARYSMFVTLRRGLTSLVEALAARLPPGTVRLETPVDRMVRQSDGWRLWPAGGGPERFDAVILATPSHESARLLQPTDASLADDLGRIVHAGTAIVTVAYRRRQIRHKLDGMGFVVPAVERSPVLAGSFSSRKYVHRAGRDGAVPHLRRRGPAPRDGRNGGPPAGAAGARRTGAASGDRRRADLHHHRSLAGHDAAVLRGPPGPRRPHRAAAGGNPRSGAGRQRLPGRGRSQLHP